MKERVSVLVTFYNQEKYVDQALQSIINQKTKFNVKILVGDDGSSDNTQERVRKWIKKYPNKINLYVMDRQPGEHISGFRASKNRLNLLNYVDTEYFIFLDGDDYFDYDGKLQKQVKILDNEANVDCIACGHNTDMLYPDGRRIPITSTKLREGKYGAKEYWDRIYFHTDTLLTRSSVIPTIDRKLVENNFNDNLITFALIQQGKLYFIPESWAVYLQTGDGIWTSGNAVVNNIRNMFLYDLCNQMNPDMKKQTSHRFSNTWMELLRLRKQINPAALEPFSTEAKDKNMKDSYNWINYKNLSLFNKQKLCLKAFIKCWKQIIRDILSKIYHATLKRGK